MSIVDLSGVDLNLLVALDALLEERSVTRAARRVGLTQPSMSHALARLRRQLDDPLLVRAGRAMVPTPRAEALRTPLRRALAELSRLLREEGEFEPKRSERTFVLFCPDLLAAFLPDLLAAMSEAAPRVRLEVRSPPEPDVAGALGAGAGDLFLGAVRAEGPGLVGRTLGEVTWAVLARRGHPAARGRLTPERWVAHPHVQVRVGSPSRSFVDVALAEAGLERTIGLTVPGFLVAPEVVARTDYLFTAPRELVAPLARRRGLVLREPPVPIPPVRVASLWHERMHADPAHRWFRDTVAKVVASVTKGLGGAVRRAPAGGR